MTHYNSDICTDEELLEELRKLGYDDEVPPDLFDRMKEDLAELVDKEQSSGLNTDCVDDKDVYSMSSRQFPNNSSPDHRTVRKAGKSSDNTISRKTKKKNQHGNSNVSGERDYQQLRSEATEYQDTGRARKTKSISNESLGQVKPRIDEYSTAYGSLPYEYNDMYKLKTNDKFTKFQNTKDVNKNDCTKYKNGTNSLAKDKGIHSDYYFNNDHLIQDTDISKNKHKTKTSKDKIPSSFDKSPKSYHFHSVQRSLNYNSDTNVIKASKFDKNLAEDNKPIDSYRYADYNLNSTPESSKCGEIKTMKRKVLRRRNGRSIITEEFLEIPSIFETSYPEAETFTSGKSFSSDDLSCKSNSSTGSTTVLSPESMKSCPSTSSLVSTRSSSLRVPNSRKKEK